MKQVSASLINLPISESEKRIRKSGINLISHSLIVLRGTFRWDSLVKSYGRLTPEGNDGRKSLNLNADPVENLTRTPFLRLRGKTLALLLVFENHGAHVRRLTPGSRDPRCDCTHFFGNRACGVIA